MSGTHQPRGLILGNLLAILRRGCIDKRTDMHTDKLQTCVGHVPRHRSKALVEAVIPQVAARLRPSGMPSAMPMWSHIGHTPARAHPW